jgi:NAD(P)-dependent dehydrogenase (short-subunit alcohol dehydrogenase family)
LSDHRLKRTPIDLLINTAGVLFDEVLPVPDFDRTRRQFEVNPLTCLRVTSVLLSCLTSGARWRPQVRRRGMSRGREVAAGCTWAQIAGKLNCTEWAARMAAAKRRSKMTISGPVEQRFANRGRICEDRTVVTEAKRQETDTDCTHAIRRKNLVE